ncbi:helix-turn-helix domain-containing protein [Actinopolymorpha alba]|uniref:helix-turn-helix domain-containing protein n=1 Tax=Actinopolymorpha alba TaxID=533267 RepID=UPI00036B01F9|nr:helix-turn-helix transcriptional regulator [Actinopolymorpha alba]
MINPAQRGDDQLARRLYARMHERGESLDEAAAGLQVTATEANEARDQLLRLGLLNPSTQTTVDAGAALARSLRETHRVVDHLVEQQVRAASLARDYLSIARQGHSDVRVEYFDHGDSRPMLQQRIDELADLARHETLAMHPVANWTRESLEIGTARNKRVITRGVRVRTLHAQTMMSDPLLREYLRARAEDGGEVRVAPVIPTRMLVYDRQIAIVQADPDDLQAGAVLIHGQSLARSLAAIFDYCWMTASELRDVPRSADGALRTEQQRAVLRALATGAKDDAIARSLGVSTRTVTRLVGELTAMLGAESRFQAGVRAAKLGWLD